MGPNTPVICARLGVPQQWHPVLVMITVCVIRTLPVCFVSSGLLERAHTNLKRGQRRESDSAYPACQVQAIAFWANTQSFGQAFWCSTSGSISGQHAVPNVQAIGSRRLYREPDALLRTFQTIAGLYSRLVCECGGDGR